MTVQKVSEPDSGARRETVHRLVVIALVGVLVVTWGAVIWLVQGKNSADDEVERVKESYAAGPEARAEAERILAEMISFDHREIRDEYGWTRYLGDDELREEYEQRIIPRLTKLIRRTRATAEGEVVKSAYDQIDEDHVDVLAFIRQTLTDVDNKDGVVADQWASLSMSRYDDGWLIDKIDIVSVPPPS